MRGGAAGLLLARLAHLRKAGWLLLKRLGSKAYRALRESRLALRFWHPRILRIRVMTRRGPLVKYCAGRRTVARWLPGTGGFEVQKPYDLVLFPPEPAQ